METLYQSPEEHWGGIEIDLEKEVRNDATACLGEMSTDEAIEKVQLNQALRVSSWKLDQNDGYMQKQPIILVPSQKFKVKLRYLPVLLKEKIDSDLTQKKIANPAGLAQPYISNYISKEGDSAGSSTAGIAINIINALADEDNLSGDKRVEFIHRTYEYAKTGETKEGTSKEYLRWHDLKRDDVYHIAHLENYARDAATDATEQIGGQEAATILSNHEARANSWFADLAAIRGDWPVHEQRFIETKHDSITVALAMAHEIRHMYNTELGEDIPWYLKDFLDDARLKMTEVTDLPDIITTLQMQQEKLAERIDDPNLVTKTTPEAWESIHQTVGAIELMYLRLDEDIPEYLPNRRTAIKINSTELMIITSYLEKQRNKLKRRIDEL